MSVGRNAVIPLTPAGARALAAKIPAWSSEG